MKRPLALWGGVECTVNRVRDRYFSQLERSGHAVRLADLDLIASLGIGRLRYPALWELIAPDGLERADWSWLDARLARLRELGIEPILGLLHHGSGPPHTHLLDPAFPAQLAAFAGAVARRHPQVRDYTPVNEPNTTARFSALYGVWYPHERSDAGYVRALLNEVRATVLAMREIRAVNPEARLVQTDDLGKTYGTPGLRDIAEFYNERRWLAWDLLGGRVDGRHPLHAYLRDHGASADDLAWLRDNPCPPDVVGLNYYVTGERWIDERVDRYPASHHGGSHGRRFADIEVARALQQPLHGIGPLIDEVWARYRRTLAVTEVHIDANREDQLRWIDEVWRAAEAARAGGVDIEAVTVWSLFGSFDWNCLVTHERGYYEPGAFDVRSGRPRPTAVATLMREIAAGRPRTHPVLQGQGWWRRGGRFLCDPVDDAHGLPACPPAPAGDRPRPLLIVGAHGTLGRAFVRLCARRDLAVVALGRAELDACDADAVARAIAGHRPWAVVNAAGYVRVGEAEREDAECLRGNAHAAAVLAAGCAAAGIGLLTFSSDLVFDGRKAEPYLEGDPVAPLNAYGRSKAEAERRVAAAHPGALVVRTSAFFGPWDEANFLVQGLRRLARGESVAACERARVSPTYVPDLVHACLDLLIDGEPGLRHLSNGRAVSWAGWLREAARRCGLDDAERRVVPGPPPNPDAPQPGHSVLASAHGALLPTLDSAMARFADAWCGRVRGVDEMPVAVRRGTP